MKLITKTNRYFSLVILVLLPIASSMIYASIHYFLSDEVDEKLRVDEMRIVEQLKANPSLISMAPLIEVEQVNEGLLVEEGIHNIVAYDPIEKEDEPFRELVSKREINGIYYVIKVRHSILEDKDFILIIVLTMSFVLVVMMGFLYVLNNRLSLRLWQPFYSNLYQLQRFSLSENEGLKLESSTIDEFEELKRTVQMLTDKLQTDYRSLKEFTENASHELQTPLAIISMNLEEVLQAQLDDTIAKKVYAAYQSVKRLSKLNERLLLLTKLDNDQFENKTEIHFNSLIQEKIEEFQPLFDERNMRIELHEEGEFNHDMDPVLATILLVNLFSNAVKYGTGDSLFTIVLKNTSLDFINHTNVNLDADNIFKRFKRSAEHPNATGLGLAIVKRITEVSQLEVWATASDSSFRLGIKKR